VDVNPNNKKPMTMVQFKLKECEYAEQPGFGAASFFAQLKSGKLAGSAPFFSHQHMNHSSQSDFVDRRQLSIVLGKDNERAGNPLDHNTTTAIQNDGRFIMTGHQPVIMTGPLFTFLKAVSVISLCRKLEKHSKTPLIPGFWIATEDHDVLEVNRFTINSKQFVWDYKGKIETNRMPQVGDINLKDCREPLLKFLSDRLPRNDFYEWVLDMVSSCRFDGYGQMFAGLLLKIFKEWPIVFVDPIALRPLSAPVLALLVERWEELEEAFEKGKKLVRKHGFVPPLSRINLFEIVNKKRVKCRIQDRALSLSTGDKSYRSAAVDIRGRPFAFSSGAGLRPLVQDAVLPVMIYVGGSEELLYCWQIAPLYEAANITSSKRAPRISATFLESKIIKAAQNCGLYPENVFQARQHLINYKPDITVLDETNKIDEQARELLICIENFQTEQNKKWVKKSLYAIRHHIDKLKSRLADERLFETGSGRKNLEKVALAVMPSGRLQERVINVFQFLSAYGPDFVSLCLDTLDPEKLCHLIVEIEPKR